MSKCLNRTIFPSMLKVTMHPDNKWTLWYSHMWRMHDNQQDWGTASIVHDHDQSSGLEAVSSSPLSPIH